MTAKRTRILKTIIICIFVITVIAVPVILSLTVDDPGDIFKNIERSDVESITGETVPEGSHGELKGDNIDKFIQLIRSGDYKRTDRTGHEIDGAGGPYFTIKLKNGEEHMIYVISGYTYKGTEFKGFISVDDGPWYECDTRELQKLYYINSDSRYKEYYQTH